MRIRALAVLVLISTSPAFAEDPPDMVVTATRIPASPKDVAAGVTVIERSDIEAHGYNTLAEALENVPGLHVSPQGGPGGSTSVFVRGTNSNHVLVLRDGMPINDASDPNGAYNFGVDTLSDIERIEVVRGPMAALYGSGAIGGVINLISRRGTEKGIHWQGDIAGGYPALIRGSIVASGIEGPLDFALTAESQSQRGYDSTPQRETVYRDVAQGYRDRILTLNLGYTPVEGTRLSLFLRGKAAYFGYNSLGGFDAFGDPVPTFDDANTNGKTTSLFGRIGGTTRLFNDALESGLFLGHVQDDRKYLEPFQAIDPNQAASDARYHAYRTDLQWNNTLHLDDFVRVTGLSASALTFGFEDTRDTINERYSSSSLGGTYGSAARASMTTDAIYAGLQTTVVKRLVLTGQVRQDWVTGSEAGTWRFGGVYNLKEIATHLKASYGTGFRAPSLVDRYGVDSYGFVGNPSLKPERSAGWEAGFVTDFPAQDATVFASIGATYFDQRITDLIDYVYSPVFTEANLDSAHVHGVETEATIHPVKWLDLHATYTLLNTVAVGQSSAKGSQLLRRPQNSASFDATVRPLPGLRIVGSLIYTGSAHDLLIGPNGYSGDAFGAAYGIGQHGLIFNAAVNYAVTPQVELYVNGWNIFNSRFEPVNGYQTPGPTVLAGARIRL